MIDRTSHNDAERAAREKPEMPAHDLQPHYWAARDRYEHMRFRFTGNSGLQLPAISLGLWHNFGDDTPFQRQRDIIRRAGSNLLFVEDYLARQPVGAHAEGL